MRDLWRKIIFNQIDKHIKGLLLFYFEWMTFCCVDVLIIHVQVNSKH